MSVRLVNERYGDLSAIDKPHSNSVVSSLARITVEGIIDVADYAFTFHSLACFVIWIILCPLRSVFVKQCKLL